MGNFLQEFDRSNGYVLFFISLPTVAYLRKLKQRKKNYNFWISWRQFGPPQEIIFGG